MDEKLDELELIPIVSLQQTSEADSCCEPDCCPDCDCC
jgi:hypothetical protein